MPRRYDFTSRQYTTNLVFSKEETSNTLMGGGAGNNQKARMKTERETKKVAILAWILSKNGMIKGDYRCLSSLARKKVRTGKNRTRPEGVRARPEKSNAGAKGGGN